MPTIITDCPHCSQKNRIDSESLSLAKCGICKQPLVIENIQQEITEKHANTQVEIEKEMEAAGKHFSDEKFWGKLKKFAKKAGSSVVYAVLLLYYTMQKPNVPMKAKAIIISALGYFILPFDLIPDVAVGVGYTDDLGALGVALLQVAMYIDDDIKQKAKDKLKDWFGDNVDTSDIDAKL
jgi:uncharacterized membrane protein YkvA (DUF1232 family)